MNSQPSEAMVSRSSRENVAGMYPAGKHSRVQNEITVQELWQIFRKRRSTFFLCLAAATLAAFLISVALPKRYEGVGRLSVDLESPDSLGLPGLAQGAGTVDTETKLQTQVHILDTDSLAWEVIRRLRLDRRPEAAPGGFILGSHACLSGPGQSLEAISPDCRRALLDEFHERLHVQSVPKTEIIEIRFRSRSPELAANVVNTLTETYVEKNFQTKYQASMRVSSWLTEKLGDVKQNAELAEEKFIAYQKQNGIIGTDENHNVLIERLNSINQQLVNAEANRIVREARYRVAMAGDPEALVEISPGSPLQLLHAEETALKNQYAQLDAKYGEAYPRVVQLRAQLEKAAEATKLEIDRSRDKIKSEYEAALQSESLLRNEFERLKQQAYDTNQAAIQVALLKRDVDASRELYEQLTKKLKEAGILAGLRATNVAIIDPAGIPVTPAEPRLALNLALGMLAGSVGGLALCFLRETVDPTISGPNDVADIASLPALGIVPSLRPGNGRMIMPSLARNGTSHVAALERPESEVADAYRSLRTTLLRSSLVAPPKILLVTSPLPREGKTTTSINSSVVFAQKNRRVLLVDADLRQADVHRFLNLPANGGLSAALAGEPTNGLYVQHPTLPNLRVLPAGECPPKVADLLDSDRMRDLVASWRQEFDQVIIDAPPVIGLSDTVILATMADMVLLVLRAQQSRRQDLSRAREILASVDAKVGGAIITGCDLDGPGYYGNRRSVHGRYFNNSNGEAKNAGV